MTVATVNQDIWRGGNYPPIVWGFGPENDPAIPDGASYELDIRFNSARGARKLVITSAHPTLAIDLEAGTVAWAYSEDQIAEMDRTSPITYSLRYVDDLIRQVWVVGQFFIRG